MAETIDPGCTRPTAGPTEPPAAEKSVEQQSIPREESKMIMVGQPAPDFTAPGFHQGQFIEAKLSDYYGNGKWALLCFYPGDFTFV